MSDDIPRFTFESVRQAQRRIKQMRAELQGSLSEPKYMLNAERRRQEEIRSVASEEAFRKLFVNGNESGEGDAS